MHSSFWGYKSLYALGYAPVLIVVPRAMQPVYFGRALVVSVK